MKNDVSKISVSVIVNHTAGTTTVKMSGEKTPVSFIQTVSQSAYLAALRDAAFYLLDKAATLDEKNPTLLLYIFVHFSAGTTNEAAILSSP